MSAKIYRHVEDSATCSMAGVMRMWTDSIRTRIHSGIITQSCDTLYSFHGVLFTWTYSQWTTQEVMKCGGISSTGGRKLVDVKYASENLSVTRRSHTL